MKTLKIRKKIKLASLKTNELLLIKGGKQPDQEAPTLRDNDFD